MVNRLWQHHMGRGIVATPNDFGSQGSRPSHPELLDWLADALVKNGWRLKPIHRLIVTSAVYMQDSRYDEARAAVDRDNVYHWRHTPRRLEAEPIRDAMLAAAGRLDTRMFGPGTLDPAMPRRSVYFRIKRSQLVPMMMLFDWPEHLVSIGQRGTTTTAPQALSFLNGDLARALRQGFADRVAIGSRSAVDRDPRLPDRLRPRSDRRPRRGSPPGSSRPSDPPTRPKAGPIRLGRRPSTFVRRYWK